MATMTDTDFTDLVNSTLRSFDPKGRFNEIAATLRGFEMMPRMMRDEADSVSSGGEGFHFHVMTASNGAAQMVGLTDEDNVNFANVMARGFVPWRRSTTSYTVERRMLQENSGASQLYKMIKAQRAAGMLSYAELLEAQGWGKPTDSSDVTSLWGIPHFVVKGTPTSTEGSFSGGNPAGFSDCAGLNSSTYTRWNNWTANYVNINKDDAVTQMRRAAQRTAFKSPVDIDDYSKGNGQRFRLYVNGNTRLAMETVGENQNENLGRDLSPMDGTGMSIAFRGSPIIDVAKLDADTSNPIYMLDFNWMSFKFLEGDMFRESEAKEVPLRHNWRQVFVDSSHNLVCTERSRQAVIWQA